MRAFGDPAAAMSKAPSVKSTSPTSSAFLRPTLSLNQPPMAEPTPAPSTAALTMTSWIQTSLQVKQPYRCQKDRNNYLESKR